MFVQILTFNILLLYVVPLVFLKILNMKIDTKIWTTNYTKLEEEKIWGYIT